MPSNHISLKGGPKLWMAPLLIVYLLLLAEGFIRIADPKMLAPRYVVDSGYGVRSNWPSIEYQHFSKEYGSIDFKINAKGVRSPIDIAYEKPEGVFRVVTFGDSFTMGYGAEYEQSYSQQLQKFLQPKTACRIEVINLGVSGHGTAEELITLDQEGRRYAPDAVLIQWHMTDLGENLRSGLFRLEGEELVRANSEYLPAVKIREKLFSYRLYRYLASHSMFYTWLRNRMSRLTQDALLRVREAEIQETETKKPELTKSKPVVESNKRLSLALLGKAKETANAMNADFYILDIPVRISRVEFKSSLPATDDFINTTYNPIQDFEQHRGTMMYWEESAGHLTPIGNTIVGQGLANMIEVTCK